MSYFRKLSLKVKVTCFLVLLTVIPLVSTNGLLGTMFTSMIEEGIHEQQLTVAVAQAKAIDTMLDNKIRGIQGVVQRNQADFQNGALVKIHPLLVTMKASNDDVQSYAYVNAAGQGINHENQPTDISRFDNFKLIKEQKKIAVSDILKSAADGSNIIIIDVPILGENGEFRGLIQALLSPDRILKDLNSVDLGESGYAYLLSKDGTYLAHRDAKKIGQSYADFADADKIQMYKDEVLSKQGGNVDYTELDGTPKTASYAAVEKTGWRVIVSGEMKALMKKAISSQQGTYMFIALCSVLIAAIAFAASLLMVRPVMNMTAVMKKAAEGDFTARLKTKGGDELQELQQNINLMLDSFSRTVTKLSEAVKHTAASAEELESIAADSSRSSEQTAQSLQHIVQGSETQMQGSEQAAVAMEEMAQGIQRIAESTGYVNEASQGVLGQVTLGDRVVQSALRQISVASERVEHSGKTVMELEHRSKEITKIVQYISQIAVQTNILSLNAGIEAARAGEHGRGFAVVASEIRKLAEQTSQATESVGSILEEIQVSAEHSSSALSESIGEVQKGVDQVQKVGDIFAAIVKAVQEVTMQVEEVSAATEQMSASTEEVTASMHEMVGVSKKAVEQLSVVSQATSSQHQSMEEIAASAESLSRLAAELQEMVRQFKL